jgi:hypothetical protein
MNVWQREGRKHNTDDKCARAFIQKPFSISTPVSRNVLSLFGFQPLQQRISLLHNSPTLSQTHAAVMCRPRVSSNTTLHTTLPIYIYMRLLSYASFVLLLSIPLSIEMDPNSRRVVLRKMNVPYGTSPHVDQMLWS